MVKPPIIFVFKRCCKVRMGSKVTIGACRAYFQQNGITAGDPAAGVRAFVLSFSDDGATGIVSLSANDAGSKGNGTWYTLGGVRLSGQPTVKGIYINTDGRKVMIK